jgi:hypothetical protein
MNPLYLTDTTAMCVSKNLVFLLHICQAGRKNRHIKDVFMTLLRHIILIVRRANSQMGDGLTFSSGMCLDEEFMLYLNYKLGPAGVIKT